MLHGAILKAARGTKNLLSFLVFHFGFFPSVSMEMEWGEKRTNKNLIGKLLGKGPDFLNMGWIMRTWRPRKGVRVTVLGNNFYLFSFDLEEDFLRAWARGTVFMGKQCLVVRRWHPKLEGDDRNMCCAQVWIRLSGLHYQELLSSKIISEIASELGQAIAIDSSDGEVSMCVEVDVNQPLVMEVMVEDGMGGGVWQSLQYEIPMLCFNCGRMDHQKEECVNYDPRGDGDHEYGPHNMAPMKHAREPVFASLRYVSWRRPCSGWVKLNLDGAVKGRSQRGGAGGLLRDAEGEFMTAFATPVATTRSLFAEVYALREGLELAVECGVEYLWIEGDSRIAIEMLNGWREAEAEEKALMVDSRNLMKGFKGVTARHVFREANQSADHLANLGVEAGVHQEWRSRCSPPPSLLPLLWRDLAGCLVPRLVL